MEPALAVSLEVGGAAGFFLSLCVGIRVSKVWMGSEMSGPRANPFFGWGEGGGWALQTRYDAVGIDKIQRCFFNKSPSLKKVF